MAQNASQVLQSTGDRLKGLSNQQRWSYGLAVVAGIVIFATMLAIGQHQSKAPLLTNLTEEDAGQIVERLNSEHVPFELAAGGSAILVPENQVHMLRLKLAGEGLPKGGNVGFELFDSPSFGQSRFAEQVNYRRGLEGELRRSIRQIDAVLDARVHIVVPEQGLFREQDRPATAAVTLHMRPGRHLSGTQTQAIVHLVASSVAGLQPDQVTVVDSQGNILAKGGESQNGGLFGALEQQRVVESGIEERVKAVLAPVVGSKHVVVRANAHLDFSRTERTTESYDPASSVLRSEQSTEEKRTGAASAQAGGVAGARSNLNGVSKEQQSSLPGASGEKRSATHNYEINKIVAHELGAQGRLLRLSVAVLVDGVEVTGADGQKTLRERTPEELGRFENLVRRAMGFDEDRDDQVVVQSMAFEPIMAPEPDAPEEAGTPKWMFWLERFWPPLVALIAVGLVAMGVLRRRPQSDSLLPQGLLGQEPRTVQELEAALASHGLGSREAFANMPPDVRARLSTRLEPQLAAKVLKGWLSEAS